MLVRSQYQSVKTQVSLSPRLLWSTPLTQESAGVSQHASACPFSPHSKPDLKPSKTPSLLLCAHSNHDDIRGVLYLSHLKVLLCYWYSKVGQNGTARGRIQHTVSLVERQVASPLIYSTETGLKGKNLCVSVFKCVVTSSCQIKGDMGGRKCWGTTLRVCLIFFLFFFHHMYRFPILSHPIPSRARPC